MTFGGLGSMLSQMNEHHDCHHQMELSGLFFIHAFPDGIRQWRDQVISNGTLAG